MSLRQELRSWYKSIPNLYDGSFRREWVKALQRKSMKSAVSAKCRDCVNWQNTEVKECSIVTCPLWQYRPLIKRNSKLKAEIIAIVTEMDKNERNIDD